MIINPKTGDIKSRAFYVSGFQANSPWGELTVSNDIPIPDGYVPVGYQFDASAKNYTLMIINPKTGDIKSRAFYNTGFQADSPWGELTASNDIPIPDGYVPIGYQYDGSPGVNSYTLLTIHMGNKPELSLSQKNNFQFLNILEDASLSDDGKLSLLKETLSKNIYLVGLGKTAINKASFDSLIATNMDKGTFIDNSIIDTALNNLADYIVQEVKLKASTKEIYLTLEDEAQYFTYFEDAEKDPKYAERWRYDQKPAIFENDMGFASFNLRNLDAPVNQFTKVGRYQTFYAAKDNPIWWNDEKFDNYRLWSKEADNWYLYIHRKPIPDFSFTINSTTGQYTLTNRAYDLDKQSINIGHGGGIKTLTYKWREQGQPTWNDGLPANPLARKIYEVKQTVVDFQGAQASIIRLLDATGVNKAPIADFMPIPDTVVVGKSILYKNLSYDPNGDSLTAQWWISPKGTGTFTSMSTLYEPTQIMNTIGEFDVKLRVTDSFGAYAEVTKSVTVIPNNQPPKAGFNYRNPYYIGDTILIESEATDPDNDPLTYTYFIQKQSGESITITSGDSRINTNGNLTINANELTKDLGSWIITQQVSDGKVTDSVSATITVLNQTVQGEVSHTPKWEENRQKFNLKKSGSINTPRTIDVFFPGEKFVLKGNATVTTTQIQVKVMEYPQFITSLSNSGGTWQGYIWDKSMIYLFKNEDLTFEFKAIYSNGWTSTQQIKIRILDEPYWRQYTSF
jgi:hypothetical protein